MWLGRFIIAGITAADHGPPGPPGMVSRIPTGQP